MIRNVSMAKAVAPLSGLFLKFHSMEYKNYVTDHHLKQYRNSNYANIKMLYGFENKIIRDLDVTVDLRQLQTQADIFQRQMIANKTSFDFKRVLGPFTQDWPRLLHEVYIYDRLKCLYYGLFSNFISSFPNNSYSFPGNILLMQILKERQFSFEVADTQPYYEYVNVKNSKDFKELSKEVFENYPEIRMGISDNPNIFVYQNEFYEGILTGLHHAKLYMETRKVGGTKDLFKIYKMDSSEIEEFLKSDSNPIANSFLSEDGEKFYFSLPTNSSNENSLRHNESVFFARAVGIVGSQLYVNENPLYFVAPRKPFTDDLTCNEMYSITGLKSDMITLDAESISSYLTINSYVSKQSGGTTSEPPS